MTSDRLAPTRAKVEALAAALAGRSAPAKRIAAARAAFAKIREDDFPMRGGRVIWRELWHSKLNPGSTAEVDQGELLQLAETVEKMRRLLALFPGIEPPRRFPGGYRR